MTTGIKIGATLWELDEHSNAHTLARQAEIAEALGFDSFWFSESHFSGPASIPSPLMALAAVASRTRTIRLASTSYLLPIRHPLQAAEEVAVLDNLSGGRVILGIGRGFNDAMFSAFNVPSADKRKLFARSLRVMQEAWSGAPISSGDADATPVYLGPRPVQQPHPPIRVAAFGPLAIKQAATLGLPYLASPMETFAQLRENYRHHREMADRAGVAPIATIPVMRTLFASRDPVRLREVRHRLSGQASARRGAVPHDEWTLVGEPAQVVAEVERYRAELGLTHLIARGRIPGVSFAEHVASLEMLAEALALPRAVAAPGDAPQEP